MSDIRVKVDGKRLGALPPEGYFVAVVAPGQHEVAAGEGWKTVTIHTNAGDERYVEVESRFGWVHVGATVFERPRDYALSTLNTLRRVED